MILTTKLIASIAKSSGLRYDKSFISHIIDKYQTEITELSDAKLEANLSSLANKLEEPLCASYWISDYHGRAKVYNELLYRRFGFIRLKITEKLPSDSKDPAKRYSIEEQDVIAHVIRTGKLPQKNNANMSNQKTINGLTEIIRSRAFSLQKVDYVRSKAPQELNQNIMNLFYKSLSPSEEERIINNPLVFNKYLKALAKICRDLILGDASKQIYLGDAFDRGDEPDFLINSFIKYKNLIKYVWGNHDILWMGAATGHRALVAEALRISFRYDQTAFIERMGIDFKKLKEFVNKTYINVETNELAFNTKAKKEENKYIEKALFVILTKLEHAIIKRNANFNMKERLYLDRLGAAIKENKKKITAYNHENKLTDFDLVGLNFPTIDPANPEKLTREEEEIINDLAEQFRISPKVQEIIGYLYNEGHSYYRHYNKLGVHSGIPCDENGDLKTVPVFGNKKGRKLFDHMEKMIKETGALYLSGKKITEKDVDYQYFLWCGQHSPFFDKHKMATWERYLIIDGETSNAGKELSLHWLKNMKDQKFIQMIMAEFSDQDEEIDALIQGHTPQVQSKPDGGILRNGGNHIIIDSSIIKKEVGSIYAETSKKKYLIQPDISYEDLIKLDKESAMAIKPPIVKEFAKQRKFKDIKESKLIKVLYALGIREQEKRAELLKKTEP